MLNNYLRAFSKEYWITGIGYLLTLVICFGLAKYFEVGFDAVELLTILVLFEALIILNSARNGLVKYLKQEYGEDWYNKDK